MSADSTTLHDAQFQSLADKATRQLHKFHAHVYYDHNSEDGLKLGHDFKKLTEAAFNKHKYVIVEKHYDRPVGPHPIAMFEVVFFRQAFADFIPWLQYHRPKELSILIHPLTHGPEGIVSQLEDHTSRALWLGKQLEILPQILIESDERYKEEVKTTGYERMGTQPLEEGRDQGFIDYK